MTDPVLAFLSSIFAPLPHRRSTSLAPSTPSQTPTTTTSLQTVSSRPKTSYPASLPRNPHRQSVHLSRRKPLLPAVSRQASSTRRASRCERRARLYRQREMLFAVREAVSALVSQELSGGMRVRWRRRWKARLGPGWGRSGRDRQGTRFTWGRAQAFAELAAENVVLPGSEILDQCEPAHSSF